MAISTEERDDRVETIQALLAVSVALKSIVETDLDEKSRPAIDAIKTLNEHLGKMVKRLESDVSGNNCAENDS